MKLFAKVVISTVLFGSLGSLAQAAKINIGSLTAVTTPGNVGAVTVTPGSTLLVGDVGSPINTGGLNSNLYNASTTATKTFFDDFVFTIPTGSSLYSISASLDTTVFAGILNFTESLYTGGGALTTFSAVGTNPLPGNSIASTPSNLLTFSNLAAGTYTLQFSGTLAMAQPTTYIGIIPVPHPAVGTYASLISVTAVPEPESYAMLIAGLGLIGAAVKRRKVTQA
jgi:hypothetical protein